MDVLKGRVCIVGAKESLGNTEVMLQYPPVPGTPVVPRGPSR